MLQMMLRVGVSDKQLDSSKKPMPHKASPGNAWKNRSSSAIIEDLRNWLKPVKTWQCTLKIFAKNALLTSAFPLHKTPLTLSIGIVVSDQVGIMYLNKKRNQSNYLFTEQKASKNMFQQQWITKYSLYTFTASHWILVLMRALVANCLL